MKMPWWCAPAGYVIFVLSTVVQFFLFSVFLAVAVSLHRLPWVLLGVLIAVVFLGRLGWRLHRPPIPKDLSIYILLQACLFGVPLLGAFISLFSIWTAALVCIGVIF